VLNHVLRETTVSNRYCYREPLKAMLNEREL